ncbi:hypothetical protein CJ030_MR3G011100 [Morella rubra]|uniref:Protein ENHANCED DISEASE RESISTANCE 2 C-terminal domain-containing protein n=1 Tax=Morella rubra TaxID=262757 RepID=A0A6A1W9Z1_9ROSI|nr:hypothetical protein CJ030_MR3G011100 [Morella rubra]
MNDRDKKKEFAANCAAYYPFGVDVFLSQRKIDHIARFMELLAIDSSGKLPPILVVNVQVEIENGVKALENLNPCLWIRPVCTCKQSSLHL